MRLQTAQRMPKTSAFLLGLSLVSIPFTYVTLFASAFLVVGYSALFVVALLQAPRIPLALLVGAALAPLAAFGASMVALRAVVFPRPSFQLAQRLDLSGLPELSQIIGEVCRRVNTRMPDQVILHAEPTFFVTQQKLRTFDGVVRTPIGMPLPPVERMAEGDTCT